MEQEYGPTAWLWEVEELVRKLLLSAVVVLIDQGSPLQVGCCRSCTVLYPMPAPLAPFYRRLLYHG